MLSSEYSRLDERPHIPDLKLRKRPTCTNEYTTSNLTNVTTTIDFIATKLKHNNNKCHENFIGKSDFVFRFFFFWLCAIISISMSRLIQNQ